MWSLRIPRETDNWKSVSHISVYAATTETWQSLYLKSSPFHFHPFNSTSVTRYLKFPGNASQILFRFATGHRFRTTGSFRKHADIPREWLKSMNALRHDWCLHALYRKSALISVDQLLPVTKIRFYGNRTNDYDDDEISNVHFQRLWANGILWHYELPTTCNVF